jgi:hypothetical protein
MDALCNRSFAGRNSSKHPEKRDRNCSSQAIQHKNLYDFTQGNDPKVEKRMKDYANQVDKVLQSLLRVCYAVYVP